MVLGAGFLHQMPEHSHSSTRLSSSTRCRAVFALAARTTPLTPSSLPPLFTGPFHTLTSASCLIPFSHIYHAAFCPPLNVFPGCLIDSPLLQQQICVSQRQQVYSCISTVLSVESICLWLTEVFCLFIYSHNYTA